MREAAFTAFLFFLAKFCGLRSNYSGQQVCSFRNDRRTLSRVSIVVKGSAQGTAITSIG